MHPDAEKALTRAWYAVMLDLYSTVLMGENAADRNRASEIFLDYTVRMGQSINPPFIPTGPHIEEDDDEVEDDD